MEPDVEYYQSLERRIKTQQRWLTLASAASGLCLGLASLHGAQGGWQWLLGSLPSLVGVLWARIELMETNLLMRIYISAVK